MTQIRKKHELDQCALYKCKSKRKLAYYLKIDYEKLKTISNITLYHSFSLQKNDGDPRLITAPKAELKKLQKRILRLLEKVKRPDYLISGEKGKSYLNNALTHQHSDYFLTIDIRKFYDNCKREYVYNFFIKMLQTSKDVACILTDIITFDNKIPTGCPTSQMLAYYAYFDMFTELKEISQRFNSIFTLYVDDMTFSSKTSFNPKALANEVDIVLRKYGHRPKYKKVKYFSKEDFKLVTGVVITKEHALTVPNRLREKIYTGSMAEKERLYTYNPREISKRIKKLRSIKGQVQAAKNIQKTIFPEIDRLIDDKLLDISSHTR
ncbi:hypothetical protein E6C60_2966 [Paenibacillus algicola]|uniref:Reverse transcriptase domain-containing protein n=1 Tax=Paenibacillus algicola TaxID=2565926 RepID=A0A4P8XLM1_9BACL|nr:reverse transcriptase family protein [Paenibacillus algicola]QCT03677.1 hypothetical protein E6C60_2966 [Paenibacillus algicola]